MIDVDAMLLAVRARPREQHGELARPAVDHAVACSDDLWVDGRRLTVRAFVQPGTSSTCIVDLRDSSPAHAALALDLEEVRLAAILAFGDALRLDVPDARLARHVELLTDGETWVGGARSVGDVATRCFGLSRVYDAISGALALAWPGASRAGSCSLGAVVVAAVDDGGTLVDVVPGGRGAAHDGPGESAWAGPILAPGTHARSAAVAVAHAPRLESGGGGARSGGDGVIARYTFAAPARVRIALDRIVNPPHGLDRAGPPSCATAVRLRGDEPPAPLAPWLVHAISAGDTLEVCTAGGAGHGFGGWGVDFDWE